mmetsp:Transcript_17591/g.42969  ORF Transcript_17591/g.42969 Transcript_17591/m.42969 type:complete len:444 (-) Transcript_17591:367-1698(-)
MQTRVKSVVRTARGSKRFASPSSSREAAAALSAMSRPSICAVFPNTTQMPARTSHCPSSRGRIATRSMGVGHSRWMAASRADCSEWMLLSAVLPRYVVTKVVVRLGSMLVTWIARCRSASVRGQPSAVPAPRPNGPAASSVWRFCIALRATVVEVRRSISSSVSLSVSSSVTVPPDALAMSSALSNMSASDMVIRLSPCVSSTVSMAAALGSSARMPLAGEYQGNGGGSAARPPSFVLASGPSSKATAIAGMPHDLSSLVMMMPASPSENPRKCSALARAIRSGAFRLLSLGTMTSRRKYSGGVPVVPACHSALWAPERVIVTRLPPRMLLRGFLVLSSTCMTIVPSIAPHALIVLRTVHVILAVRTPCPRFFMYLSDLPLKRVVCGTSSMSCCPRSSWTSSSSLSTGMPMMSMVTLLGTVCLCSPLELKGHAGWSVKIVLLR